jgi:hypothetical protein
VRKDGEYPLLDAQGNEEAVTNSSETTTGTILRLTFGNLVLHHQLLRQPSHIHTPTKTPKNRAPMRNNSFGLDP